MKKIKVGSEVLMIGYRLDELAPAERLYAIKDVLIDEINVGWSEQDFIEHANATEDITENMKNMVELSEILTKAQNLANANEYLFTKDGIMIPITHTVGPSGKLIAHKLNIAQVNVNVQLEEVD